MLDQAFPPYSEEAMRGRRHGDPDDSGAEARRGRLHRQRFPRQQRFLQFGVEQLPARRQPCLGGERSALLGLQLRGLRRSQVLFGGAHLIERRSRYSQQGNDDDQNRGACPAEAAMN